MTWLNPSVWLVAIGLLIGSFFSGVSVGKKWEEGRQAIENNHIAEAVDAANTAASQAIAQTVSYTHLTLPTIYSV